MNGLIQSMDEFESIQKSIMKLHRTVSCAAIGASTLDNKIKMQRLDLKIQQIDRDLKLQYYGIEDAISFARNTDQCPECLTINQKTGMSEIEYLGSLIDCIRDSWNNKYKETAPGFICLPIDAAEEIEHLLNDSKSRE